MQVKLISVTQGSGELGGKGAEAIISYAARVSNPANQGNFDTAEKLIRYMIMHQHWSPFEMAHMTLEITTSRAIAQQILRHRSFSFQEFSQRYAEALTTESYPARRQDSKNRQNSVDDLSAEDQEWFAEKQREVAAFGLLSYMQALRKGIAKECARFLLPLSTQTRLYMCGSARSWIHYIELRTTPGTQSEHRDIAEECKRIFSDNFTEVAKALSWRGGRVVDGASLEN